MQSTLGKVSTVVKNATTVAISEIDAAGKAALELQKASEANLEKIASENSETKLAIHRLNMHGFHQANLDLVDAQQYVGTGHGKPMATRDANGWVTLSGLLGKIPNRFEGGHQKKAVTLASLPAEMRPKMEHLFAVAVHPNGTARLDVYPDGRIVLTTLSPASLDGWDETTDGGSWPSLNGVGFFSNATN